ncbi:hypothetical protein [Vibrio sp. SCSIO 43136]|uniref:hypothetical protein n=1 Tax=Vibrio sp. SCSIO 43136 TaxID=2819101 RepID=UPI002075AF28|nr:hypothetical protein [Vibrio sp. SCSIO 43136]USD68090.1 hypothetical protein J4N39_18115 [Vibrio sp. SCSIO 43136]
MKKTVVAALVGFACTANAAGLEDISISGFGSVAIGKSNNDAGYAGYTSERFDTKRGTKAGIQFDFDINDDAKFTTQLVANGRYNFDPSIEVAYVTYELGQVTARAGKMRTPIFMYSDYLDLGYAYPMIRPSQEVYEHIIVNNYTGADLLIPFDIGETTLQLQPLAGISQVEERDSTYGEVDLNQLFGLTAHWYIDDITLRGSFATAQSSFSGSDTTGQLLLDDKKATFGSIGAQYDNGDALLIVEGMQMKLEDTFPDVNSVFALAGYRIDEVMPYVSYGYIKSSDDDERENTLFQSLSFQRQSYSLGIRWDFAQAMALKVDATYVDYKDTTGGLTSNLNTTTGQPIYDSSYVYGASLDFVF